MSRPDELLLDEPFRTLWAGQDPFRAAQALQGKVLRELEGRRTLRTEVGGRGYYVKIHRGVGWGEILKNLITARLPVLGAENEWLAIRRLTELGVDTMKAVAFGRCGSNPALQESFIITEELAPTVSLEDFCRDWPANPPLVALKRALVARVADMARRMHEGGVNHRDLYICHFLLHLPVDARAPKLSLIDLHRAQVRDRTPRRWRDKDLAALHFSALEIGLTSRDRLRFLRAYFNRPLREIFAEEAALLAHLEREGDRLTERYRRKFAPKDAVETAETLRAAGRQPPTPCRVEMEDGRMLTLTRPLRILPGKRLTGAGEVEGRPVLAKLFIARGSERHWTAERGGIEALAEHDILTPRLLAAGRLKGGGHYLLTEFIEDAAGLSHAQDAVPLRLTFGTLGRMHACNLVQDDPHPGNFLFRDGQIFVIDGDAIRQRRTDGEATENLALLLVQLTPERMEESLPALLAAYHAGNPRLSVDPARLKQAVSDARASRLRDLLGKCLRDCSLFRVEKQHDRFVSVAREESGFLAPILADPDRFMEGGIALKRGRTSTLAQVGHGGRRLVIKRYNIKGAGHALSRFWRPSRAWHSWIEGHRLRFLGIETSRPLALVEARLGPLRGRAWLVTEYCEGENLQTRLADCADTGAPPEVREAVRGLFARLAAERISHGDLKATNFLCAGSELCVLDLDAMRPHGNDAAWRKAWRKDRNRFLANWPEGSRLRREFDEILPAA